MLQLIFLKKVISDSLKCVYFICVSFYADEWDELPAYDPPPYQLPPAYYNTAETLPNDPFDTSNIYASPKTRYYSPVSPSKKLDSALNNETTSTLKESPKFKLPLSENGHNFEPTKLEDNFIAELEQCFISNKHVEDKPLIPVLEPPPSKIHNTQDRNSASISVTNNYDQSETATLFNKMWHDMAASSSNSVEPSNLHVSNLTSKSLDTSQNNITSTEFGTFRCNQNKNHLNMNNSKIYDKCYSDSSSQSNFDSNCLYSSKNLNAAPLYSNAYIPPNNHKNIYETYGSVQNNVQQYNEIDDRIYTEISEHLYSPVAEDTLRPHRPAPPSPLVLGQPQSMQQIQRKLQTGQVSRVCCII